MKFQKVRKEHILQGIEDFKENGYPDEFGPSSTYDLVHNGERFPPKAIMAYAQSHVDGDRIKSNFTGGQNTDCFNAFEREGFKILFKNDPILDLIARYKTYIAETKMQDEVYKWRLVSEYSGRPDINAADFSKEMSLLDCIFLYLNSNKLQLQGVLYMYL